MEKKDLASKYEQLEALAESSELMHKHDSAMNKSALAESRKREESLKKTVSVKDACIASVSLWNSSPSLTKPCMLAFSDIYFAHTSWGYFLLSFVA